MIAPEGWPFALIPFGAGVILAVFGLPWLGWSMIALGLFAFFFFRDPPRVCAADSTVLCSPADGRVIAVDTPSEPLRAKGFDLRIAVFMSALDVHVNRAPADGRLVASRYTPGRKLPAYREKASADNEQTLSEWVGPHGTFAVSQIAGIFARRIVFDHAPGDEVRRGDRIGLIRFGSRVELFVPRGFRSLVDVGDRVRAGETPMAAPEASGVS